MAKRKIRTRDQLPRALSRVEKIAAKREAAEARMAEKVTRFIGVDIGRADETCVVAVSDDGFNAIRRLSNEACTEADECNTFMGLPIVVNDHLPDDQIIVLRNGYDFRKRHGD